MLSNTEILTAMQFSFFNERDPINSSSDPRQVMTYQFAGTTAPPDLPTGTTFTGWRDFTAAEKAAFADVLDHIETFLNVEFVEVTGSDDPDLNVGAVDIPGSTAGYGGFGASILGTEVTIDSFVVYDNLFDYADGTHVDLMMHEMGHALGLRHPFGSATSLPDEYDNNRYTVMSYTDNPDNGMSSDAMMLFDVLALQDIWGAAAYNEGRTVYTGSRTETVDVIWDTGGKDKLNASAQVNDVILDLRAGYFSSFEATNDVVIAFGTRIEHATGGSGNDEIFGNGARNTLVGKAGDDLISGKGGNDKLSGGRGEDVLRGDNGRDIMRGGAGNDEIRGGKGNDTLYGQKGDDILFGNAGKDRFVFKNADGADTIRDFRDDTDTLKIIGHGDADSLLARAEEIGGDVVFDFGGGNSLTVEGISIAQLADDLIA